MSIRIARVFLTLVLGVSSGLRATESAAGAFSLTREWVWSELGVAVGFGGLETVDLDGDGDLEILVTGDVEENSYDTSGRWYELEVDGALHQTWSSLPYEVGLDLVRTAASVGETEIVAVAGDTAFVHAGSDKRLLRTIDLPSFEILDLEIADIDGAPGLELVACDDDALYVLDFEDGAVLSTRYGFGGSDLEVGQVDGDGALEIAIAGNALGGFVLDGSTLQPDWADVAGFGAFVRMTDLDGDGRDELVRGEGDALLLRASDPESGATLWTREDLGALKVASGDLDLDDDPELLVSAYGDSLIHILDGGTGEELSSFVSPTSDVQAIVVGDVVPGGTPEIVWGAMGYGPGHLLVATASGDPILAESALAVGPFFGFFAGDVDAQAGREFVTGCQYFLQPGQAGEGGRSLAFDPASRRLDSVGPTITIDGYTSGAVASVTLNVDEDPALETCLLVWTFQGSGLGCGDGASGELQWQVELPDDAFPISMQAAQLDSDPGPELLVGTNRSLVYAFEGESGWLAWRSPELPQTYYEFDVLRAVDVIGDPAPEIVAAATDYFLGAVAIFDAATGALAYGPYEIFLRSLETTQLDSDSATEIVVGTEEGDVRPFDPQNGALLPPIYTGTMPILGIRFADMTRDGTADLVLVADSKLHLVDGVSGSEVWTSPYLGSGAGSSDRLAVLDYDLDTLPEIAVNTVWGFALFESPLFSVFADGFESGDTSAWSSTLP